MPVKHKLNFSVIDALRTQLSICPTFVDLFRIENYKGKVHTSHGRTLIESTLFPKRYIVIDKDHSTRYLVEEIVQYVENQSENYDKEVRK